MQLFSCFLRLFLQELGFQAGQHEIVAETLSNHLQQEVIKKSKEIVKKTKNNIKEAKKISENLNRSYKDLDKCKAKYQKSQYHQNGQEMFLYRLQDRRGGRDVRQERCEWH